MIYAAIDSLRISPSFRRRTINPGI